MKTNSASRSAFSNLRAVVGLVLCSAGLLLTLAAFSKSEPAATFIEKMAAPQVGIWTPTGSLNTGRDLHTATLLPNGKVLAAGGEFVTSAELYDPAIGTWTYIGSLNTDSEAHTATLLPSGKVLVAGGGSTTGYVTSAELYDLAIGTWTYSGRLATGRVHHTATLLPNG